LKDEKLVIDFCAINRAVMGQILVNGTLLLWICCFNVNLYCWWSSSVNL